MTTATTPKTQLQPLFGPSVDSLCHPWFTTTVPSYRFPIFETSATALCGTTGTTTIYCVLQPHTLLCPCLSRWSSFAESQPRYFQGAACSQDVSTELIRWLCWRRRWPVTYTTMSLADCLQVRGSYSRGWRGLLLTYDVSVFRFLLTLLCWSGCWPCLWFALIASHFDVARLEKSSRIRLLMMAR